ncbi:MAG: hypothetical protein Q9195_000895 [Heterodermia aff. obscurata]
MNDPGLDSPIQDGAKAVEDENREENMEDEDEQAFLNPRCAASLRSTDASLITLAVDGAQPITIIGWFIASILLIALVTTTVHRLKVSGENRALTQAFYYAIMAAALYFIIASLMCVTVYGAFKEHYPKEFRLSPSQRTLMLQTISFMVYMVGGGAVYAKIEGWKFLDAVYFTDYTLLTVGIGDYAPLTHLGRGLLFPYAIGGIVILGLVVGSIRSLVLERGKKKLGSRMIEKKREALLRNMVKKDDKTRLVPVTREQQTTEDGLTERERRKEEFLLMRMIQEQASVRQKWTALVISGSAWFVLWFVGAVIFWKAEHAQDWTYFQGLYFAYTSLLTIGFGDFKPFSNSGKAFFVFWSLLAVPTLTILISNMGDTIVKGVRDLTLYLGEFTLLPGEVGVRQRVKQFIHKLRSDKILSGGKAHIMDEPPGIISEKENADEEKGDGKGGNAMDHVAGAYERDELKAAGAAKKRGDKLAENIHEYHYLLVKEFRNVMKHQNENPPRKYSYEEWAWFLKLMGQDEASSTSHRAAPIMVNKSKDEGPDTQQAKTDDSDKSSHAWSWLGNRSPLMGEVEEAEWVLERLSLTLEKSFLKQSLAQNSGTAVDKPPVDTVGRTEEDSSGSDHTGQTAK